MSRKYKKSKARRENMEFDRYLITCEEGRYITKSFCTKDIINVYIYATIADVIVNSSRGNRIIATLQGMFGDETQYFDMFRLDRETVYIFATCNAQSVAHSRLYISLPKNTDYNIQVVTNCGEAVVEDNVSTQKCKLDIQLGIVPKGREE